MTNITSTEIPNGREELDEGPDEFTEQFLDAKLNRKGENIGWSVNIGRAAKYLIETHKFKTNYWTQKGELIFTYKDGIWSNNGRGVAESEAEVLLKGFAKGQVVNEIISKIKRKTYIDFDRFNIVPDDKICVINGVINLFTNELLPHSEEYYFKTKLPIIYNPAAKCPHFKKLVDEAFYPADIPAFQEWLGYCLCPQYFEKKATILFGDHDTGKTTIINIITKFIDKKNISGLTLQQIAIGDSFDLLQLKDKYMNIFDDLSDRDINAPGGLKMVTGGGWVDAEIKFGDYVKFRTFAKLLFGTNKIPAVKDPDDEAYWSRWMPFPLDNAVPIEEQDKELEKKCSTEEELSGILNWALEGLQRLKNNKKFSYQRSIKEVKYIMQYSSHQLAAFASDALENVENEEVSKEEMYEAYSRWCIINEKTRCTKDQLGKQLIKVVGYILSSETGSKGRFWKHAKIKDKYKKDTGDTPKNKPDPILQDYNVPIDTGDTSFSKAHARDNLVNKSNIKDIYVFKEDVSSVSKFFRSPDNILLPCSNCGAEPPCHFTNKNGRPLCDTCSELNESNSESINIMQEDIGV